MNECIKNDKLELIFYFLVISVIEMEKLDSS